MKVCCWRVPTGSHALLVSIGSVNQRPLVPWIPLDILHLARCIYFAVDSVLPTVCLRCRLPLVPHVQHTCSKDFQSEILQLKRWKEFTRCALWKTRHLKRKPRWIQPASVSGQRDLRLAEVDFDKWLVFKASDVSKDYFGHFWAVLVLSLLKMLLCEKVCWVLLSQVDERLNNFALGQLMLVIRIAAPFCGVQVVVKPNWLLSLECH